MITASNGETESDDSPEASATPLSSSAATTPTAQEIYMLELINRARFDPEAEASRYGISLNQGLTPGTISAAQKPPLAFNTNLMRAARDHSQWMLNSKIFNHTGAGGSTPSQRMAAAGYSFSGSWAAGENISVSGTSGSNINLTQQVTTHHEGLFESAGHRVNILSTSFRQLGVGQKKGTFDFSGTAYLSSMLTENFARAGSSYYVTGVIYQDNNSNGLYNVGEGISGINVNVGGASVNAYDNGAYSIARSNGTYTVTVTGAGLPEPVSEEISVSGSNVKFDVIVAGGSVSIHTW